MSEASTDPTVPDAPELARALASELRTPLSALRASIESLVAEHDPGDPQARVLHGALREVHRLSTHVEDLVELADPRVPAPLSCTVDEILYSARFPIEASLRSRVFIAREGGPTALWTDGPLLSRALRRVLEAVLAAGAREVLAHARRSRDGSLDIHVIGDGLTKSAVRQMRLHLARHEIELLGGELRVDPDRPSTPTLDVRIPASALEQEVAA